MHIRHFSATVLAAVALGVGACVPDAGRDASSEWPLSEMDPEVVERSGGAVAAVAGHGTATPVSAPADEHQEPLAAGVTPTSAGDEGASGAGHDEVAPDRPQRPAMDMAASGPMIHTPAPPARTDFEDARFPRPDYVRGLYVNAWAAGSGRRMEEILSIVRETEVNSLVIDIKDATGFVSHASGVPAVRDVGATGEIRIRDLPALLDRLEAEGVYPIARIVVIKDPLLSLARPDLAIQDTAGGVWVDSKELIWLNPFQQEVWEYHVSLAREVAEMGFPEIQWDYIRFPDAPEADYARATFPGAEGRPRYEAIRGFLAYAREELSDLPVRSTADVFGVTTSFRRDIGLGQLWETFIDVVDVALPMVYPSHYWEGSFGYDVPNAYPYEVVKAALDDALRRSAKVDGAGLTRPWIQDFSLGQPLYGAAEVRAQIQAAYDVGIHEWIVWNPSTKYTVEALEPSGGFELEPLVRVAGVLAPVSRRQLVIDSIAAIPVVAEEEVASDSTVVVPGSPEEGPEAPFVAPESEMADSIMPDTSRVVGGTRGR